MMRLFYGAFTVAGLGYSRVCIVLVLCFSAMYLFQKSKFDSQAYVPTLLLLLLLLSDFFGRGFIFFSGLQIRPEVFWLGLFAAIVLLNRGFLSWQNAFLLLLLLQGLEAVTFIRESRGALLFSDDHPSFLYRLILLKEHFPEIPFYDVSWNGGSSAREFFASGMLNIFFVSFPIVYLFDIANYDYANAYNYIIVWGYIFLVPWAVFSASRILGLNFIASVIAAILALGPSSGFFEWLLKYGTLGFCFSSGLLPLAIALSFKLAFEKSSWFDVLSLLVVSFLVLTWSLSFLAFLPLVVLGLWKFREVFALEKRSKLAVFILFFLLLNLPWILTFINESKVGSFVTNSALPGAAIKQAEFNFTEALKDFRSLAQKVNPLLLFFWIPGLFLLESPRKRWILFSSILILLTFAFLGEQFKPQLELKRLFIPASYIMCVLSGLAIANAISLFRADIFQYRKLKKILAGASFITLSGFFCLSPLNVASILSNKSDEHFKFSDPSVKDLADGIRENADDGRVFILGFILHELGSSSYAAQDGGHVAPLAAFSGKAMYASHYYHKYWSMVDPIPVSYRQRGEAGIEEFLDLTNSSSVVTHSREWANYCMTKSRYVQIFQAGRFRFFKRQSSELGYFLRGSGEVKRAKEGIFVRPETEEVVLKFRHLPKLKVFGGGEISAEPVFLEEIGGGKTEQASYVKLRVSAEILAKKAWVKVGYHDEKLQD